ncbi:MAG: class I SAM-dependent methyltransferase [Myxococcota bacterium]
MTNNNQHYYDEFAQGYERARGRGYHGLIDDLEMEVALPFARDQRVLELGCGTGLILERLAKVASDAHGVDLSPGMIAKAKDRGLNVSLASVTALPFADESFDFVCSFKVLAHVRAIGAALQEAARVTRSGGFLALELYNPLSLRYLAKKIAGPQPIADGTTEADVYTRWDPPWVVPRVLPPSVELVDVRGVRVFTPAAFVHRIPWVAEGLQRAEHAALRSALRWFGGFLVVLLRKR